MDDLATLCRCFAAALAIDDRAAARACCTRAGLGPGETPGVLYADARLRGHRLEIVGAPRSVGDRASIEAHLVDPTAAATAPGRALWLLAEHVDGRLGLAGVARSARVADGFLAGLVPADARFARLPDSDCGRALGERVVTAFERHGRVGHALGTTHLGALAAGWMLDGFLATPGAGIALGEAREIPGRAAVRLDLTRPDLSAPQAVWLLVDLDGARDVIRTTTSAMTLDVMLSNLRGAPGPRSAATNPATPPATDVPSVAPYKPDAIDRLIETLPT